MGCGSGRDRVGGGGGLVSDFEHHHHVVHLGLGRASWQGTQGLTPTTSTTSLPVLARRVRADPHEVGRFEGIGPDLWELGPASRTGREHLQGSSPPDSTERTPTQPDTSRNRPAGAPLRPPVIDGIEEQVQDSELARAGRIEELDFLESGLQCAFTPLAGARRRQR